jgi:ribonuclease R
MKKGTRKKDLFAKREAAKYSKPIPSREFILDLFESLAHPLTKTAIIKALKLTSDYEHEALRRRLLAMVRDGQLFKSGKGTYDLAKKCDLIRGHVIGHSDGYGHVIPEDGTSKIFLSAKQMRQVFNGDIVDVRIWRIDRHNRREGIIVEVIKHNAQQIVGRFYTKKGMSFIVPSNKRIQQDILIPQTTKLKPKQGQIVTAEITSPPTARSYPIGKIIEILGDYMHPGMEIEIAIRSYDLPHEWPQKITAELAKIKDKISRQDLTGRKDLRHLPFVTIDGADAKDFDDALYCEKSHKDGFRLWVAIADVGHYVKLQTALDKEAQARGTSVYFPNKVIPMLPPALSNNLCSLKPDQDRLCMVCEMSFNKEGKVTRYNFYSAVIRSQARLTYTKVAKWLTEKKTAPIDNKNVWHNLQNLREIYYLLNKQRQQRGAIDFDTPEIKVQFDKNKKIKRLFQLQRNIAHKIVEECMLAANLCTAKFLLKHQGHALYRVHDGPKIEKLGDLKTFLKEIGLQLGGGDLPTPKDYANLIKQIENRPDKYLLQMMLLRSLSRAFYSPINDGHFGLAFEAYTHFTSPIRRYPDLIVHRAIRSIVEKEKKPLNYKTDTLQTLGEHCSMTERRADEATRDALDWLKCEFMLDKIGETYEGIISGVTGFGIFVELKDIFVEGLVHITNLHNDYYRFDPIRHRLIGERTRKIFHAGDEIKIKVVHVNLENKQIDFELA